VGGEGSSISMNLRLFDLETVKFNKVNEEDNPLTPRIIFKRMNHSVVYFKDNRGRLSDSLVVYGGQEAKPL
jgi:hypothetical protein